MMMKDRGKLVIWPAYIDQTRTRDMGRIISLKNAVKEPQLNEIKEAARKLGLNPEVEPEKAYPKSCWEKSGRVLVDDTGPKSVIAKQIALYIKKIRNQKGSAKTNEPIKTKESTKTKEPAKGKEPAKTKEPEKNKGTSKIKGFFKF
ncbi:MAG: signal recognition particle subunit [Euryarchaeota archaeon]|nr:signal recognition particle subunit [Euryarchaeota archaeon]